MLAAIERLRTCDVVFAALHGPHGKDGSARSCFAATGAAVVGCGVLAGALAMDKVRTTKLVAAAGTAVADSVTLVPGADDLDATDRARLGLPVFVKPVRAGSSLGVTRVVDWADLPDGVRLARRSDPRVLVESAVPAREIDIGVLELPDGTVVDSPALEIGVPDEAVFDYHAKYSDPSTVFAVPADLDPATALRLAEQARTAFDAIGCAGPARVDFFLRADGELVFQRDQHVSGVHRGVAVPADVTGRGDELPGAAGHPVDTALASAPAVGRAVRTADRS